LHSAAAAEVPVVERKPVESDEELPMATHRMWDLVVVKLPEFEELTPIPQLSEANFAEPPLAKDWLVEEALGGLFRSPPLSRHRFP
jgi:hypothetical protein